MNDMRKLMEGIEAVIDGEVQEKDLGESQKITAAQVSKLAAKIAVRTEPALFKGMEALGIFTRKGSEGVLGSYLQPVIVAIAKNRGFEVDSSALRTAKTLTKAMLSALSKGEETEEQIDPSVLKDLSILEGRDMDIEQTWKALEAVKGDLFRGDAIRALESVGSSSEIDDARAFAKKIAGKLNRLRKLIGDYLHKNESLSRKPPKI